MTVRLEDQPKAWLISDYEAQIFKMKEVQAFLKDQLKVRDKEVKRLVQRNAELRESLHKVQNTVEDILSKYNS